MEQNDVGESFLVLKNRSRLPGAIPSPPGKKNSGDGEENGISVWSFVEWFLAATVGVFLVVAVSVNDLREKQVFGVHLWRLVLALLTVFGTRLFCAVVVRVVVMLIHMVLKKWDGLLYVVEKIKGVVQWTMMAWVVVVVWEVNYGELGRVLGRKAMEGIEKGLIGIGVLFSVWAMKTIIVMSVAARFYLVTYHKKVSESLFYRYVVQVLSGNPMVEVISSSFLPIEGNPKGLTAWERKKMMIEKEKGVAVELRTESEARREAGKIFRNVAKPSADHGWYMFVVLEDLSRFLPNDEALKTLNLFRRTFDEDENIQISKRFLEEWMVHSFKRDRCIVLSLKDTDEASKKIGTLLNIVVTALLGAFAIPVLGFGGVKYLSVFATNSFILTYLFGQVWKELFYGMHLLYIRHPFDVGDQVKIEKTEMYVEKLKVTETDFIGRDKKKYTIGNFGIVDKLAMNLSRSELPAWTIEDDIV